MWTLLAFKGFRGCFALKFEKSTRSLEAHRMHTGFTRKLGTLRLYTSTRRKIHSYLITYLTFAIILLFAYCIYENLRNGAKMAAPKSYEVFEYQTGIFHQRSILNSSDGQYPEDVFTQYERRHGAVLLHILGLCYLFLAVALACDEFFVPSLEVIIERLHISEDVAGATFMAAGGSAPELFISLFGTFADPKSNVGIGTIVGSAVFNVLFVIGMCAMFSKRVLTLTWWPLFRDCVFYSIAILLLIVFFLDSYIHWWEALLLFCMYLFYVLFMKFNNAVERIVKSVLPRSNKVCKVDRRKDPESNNPGVKTEHYLEKAMEYLTTNNKSPADHPCFHYGALQLVVNTIDPLWDASMAVRIKHFKQMSNCAENGNKDDTFKISSTGLQKRSSTHSSSNSTNATSNGTIIQKDSLPSEKYWDINKPLEVHTDRDLGAGTSLSELTSTAVEIIPPPSMVSSVSPIPGMCQENQNERKISSESKMSQTMVATVSSQNELVPDAKDMDEIEDTRPIDLSWPDSWKDRLVYIVKAPLMFPMYCTMFDVRKPEKTKFYPWTFFMSTIWIGAFSYLMVWWATVVGDTFNIPTSIMGLTFLAAGTSIPDLITSVLVARKGFGDMAVSSSIGSNMFDITVGLPVPWMAFIGMNVGSPINVSSDGLFCSVLMLFVMLVSVVTTIALSKWRMSKLLGGIMFLLYIIFIVLSLLLEFNVISCIKLT